MTVSQLPLWGVDGLLPVSTRLEVLEIGIKFVCSWHCERQLHEAEGIKW